VFRRVALLASPFLLVHCAPQKPAAELPKPVCHVDQAGYDSLKPKDSHVRIDLVDQKARLLNANDDIVLETDVSTGKLGHETPTGKFRIMEKSPDKRSNRYGRYHDRTGRDLGPSADMPAPPKDAIYEGYKMPYWMRLTWDGVGIHVGYVVPRSAVSSGCIRVPEAVQPLIYQKCKVGTLVEIVGAPVTHHPPR